MQRRFWIGLGLALVLAGPLPVRAQDESLAIDRQQVKVWTVREPDAPLRGFRATTTVRSSLSGLVRLIMDTAAAPEWVYRTDRMQLLRSDEQAGTFTVLAEMDFWPLPDRDVVVEGRVSQDPATLVVTVDSHAVRQPALPPRAGFVRMRSMRGVWQFRPLGHGLVEVSMTGHADPGGHIPDFLINLMIKETPYRTLLGLRHVIGGAKYQQERVPGIREPL